MFDEAFNLFSDRANLSIVAGRRDDERVEGVNELAQVQDDSVNAEFLFAATTAALSKW